MGQSKAERAVSRLTTDEIIRIEALQAAASVYKRGTFPLETRILSTAAEFENYIVRGRR